MRLIKQYSHIALLAFLSTSSSHAQNYLGVHAGYNAATLLDYIRKDDYKSNYTIKSGLGISVFYEGVHEEDVSNYRVELQYQYQEVDAEVRSSGGHGSYYRDMTYSFHRLNLNLAYSFPIIKRRLFSMAIVVGPSISYNFSTHAKGNGWDYGLLPAQVDTSGNVMPSYPIPISWVKDERNTNDLSRFSAGVDLGLEFLFPVSDKVDLLVQNRYYLSGTSFLSTKKYAYTSLFTSQLNLGLRYRLG